MIRRPLRSLVRPGLTLVFATGVVAVAHASGLGGATSGSLDAWAYPASIDVVTPCAGPPSLPCVVPLGATFDGNLTWGADVIVLGTVTGMIVVDGGSVTVGTTGVVGDGIAQTGPGGVSVLLGGFVDGDLAESGGGTVLVDGHVAGNAGERDGGDVLVGPSAVVDGSVDEEGAGSVVLDGIVRQHVTEGGDGNLDVTIDGSVTGDALEAGAGDVTITGPAAVGGTAAESDDGNMAITALAIVGVASSSGDGTCTISPLATVGRREGACT